MDRERLETATSEFRDKGRPSIGVVVHESAQEEMLTTLESCLPVVRQCRLVTARDVGALCERRLELRSNPVSSDMKRGAEQVADLAAQGRLDAVMYLPNPLANPRWDVALSTLVRACNAYDVPLATNAATARALLAMVGSRLEGQRAEEATLDAADNAPHSTGKPSVGSEADPVFIEVFEGPFSLRGELGLD